MQDISNELNDQGGRSTDTRIAKLFEQSKLTEEQFIEMMYYARGKVKSIPATQIKVRGMNGQPNRVPLFMSLVEQTIEKGLEAMQAADAEYEASREERKAKEQDRQTEKPEPEFDEPKTVAQVEEPEVEQTEEPEPVAQEPEINPEYENWHNQLEATAKENQDSHWSKRICGRRVPMWMQDQDQGRLETALCMVRTARVMVRRNTCLDS